MGGTELRPPTRSFLWCSLCLLLQSPHLASSLEDANFIVRNARTFALPLSRMSWNRDCSKMSERADMVCGAARYMRGGVGLRGTQGSRQILQCFTRMREFRWSQSQVGGSVRTLLSGLQYVCAV